ncbi:hypothetical protein L2E82_37691 [Cichorium intybus]|uniref:Uncharacterized protein n=1 Tax=Cichorium intybus TaxID=13427 RepID=A0ACB9AJ86_CICIN|nr:hypothetical protein L2E82_37691 [Cichorium intybus]
MAEADPEHNKMKKTTFSIPPWRYTNEIEDTATSKRKEEEIEEVDYDNIEIMHEILAYRNRNGVCPCSNPDDLRIFCFPYVHMGIGNEGGWFKKMKEMKNKFNIESAPMEDVEKKEFELWKKIWGNERKGDDDLNVSSCK